MKISDVVQAVTQAVKGVAGAIDRGLFGGRIARMLGRTGPSPLETSRAKPDVFEKVAGKRLEARKLQQRSDVESPSKTSNPQAERAGLVSRLGGIQERIAGMAQTLKSSGAHGGIYKELDAIMDQLVDSTELSIGDLDKESAAYKSVAGGRELLDVTVSSVEEAAQMMKLDKLDKLVSDVEAKFAGVEKQMVDAGLRVGAKEVRRESVELRPGALGETEGFEGAADDDLQSYIKSKVQDLEDLSGPYVDALIAEQSKQRKLSGREEEQMRGILEENTKKLQDEVLGKLPSMSREEMNAQLDKIQGEIMRAQEKIALARGDGPSPAA